MYRPNLQSVALPVPEIIYSVCSFGLGLRTPILGKGGRRGSEMVPFERALVSSYRPSVVTFPLSLRVSEILSLLCSSTPLFYTPPPQNFPMFPCSDDLWATKSELVGLIVRAISFQDFQHMWSWPTNVTDGRTDRQTDGRHAVSVPRLVHRAVIIQWSITVWRALSQTIWRQRTCSVH